MDKKQFLGFILIGLVIFGYMLFTTTQRRETPIADKPTDSIEQRDDANRDAPSNAPDQELNDAQAELDEAFAPYAQGIDRTITISTDYVEAQISSKGAVLTQWTLKDFKNYQGGPVELLPSIHDNLPYTSKTGEFGITFASHSGRPVDTRNLYFTLEAPGIGNGDSVTITGDQTLTLRAELEFEDGAKLIKTYTFTGNSYLVSADVGFEQMSDIIATRRYEVDWSGGLKYQESNSVEESSYAHAMMSLAGDIEDLDATEPGKTETIQNSGQIDYIAVKSKYFVAAIIPTEVKGDITARLNGRGIKAPNEGFVETYGMAYRLQYRGANQTDKFQLYIGPLDYDIVAQYGLAETVQLGIAPIRLVSEYLILPIFNGVHSLIPNYGFAIIVFSILIKILLYPLSITQMRSVAKMQVLGPEMQKLRDKHKDDPKLQQQAMMKLYSEYGVNPASGCFPLLLQMPILYALWEVFRSAISLRQTEFFGWITDLSVPDVLFDIGFKLPLIGIDKVSGLALMMGLTLFIQQKITITDPRQKALVYVMPIMLTLLFSNFPAGLNLYYFMFNLLGIGQQIYITKFSKNKVTLEQLRAMPKKEGWLQKKMREAQEIAESQGRSVPRNPYLSSGGKSPNRNGSAPKGKRKKPTKKR